YGYRYFSFNSFVRVAAVSTIAVLISFIAVSLLHPYGMSLDISQMGSEAVGLLLAFLTLNSIFDYISVIKARFIMSETLNSDIKYKAALYFLVDAVVTAIVLLIYYYFAMRIMLYFFPPRPGVWLDLSFLGIIYYSFLAFSFAGTTFLIFFLTL